MGLPGKGAQIDALPVGARNPAEMAPDYRIIASPTDWDTKMGPVYRSVAVHVG